jgi:hypothetical protein
VQQLSKEELLVIFAALIVVAIGVVLDVFLKDSLNAFQRSGSVVVCIGIIFGYFDVGGIYDGRFKLEFDKLKAKDLERDIVFSDEELERKVRGSTNYFISRARSIQGSNKNRVKMIDVIVLISGTLIWGFGDLII